MDRAKGETGELIDIFLVMAAPINVLYIFACEADLKSAEAAFIIFTEKFRFNF